VSVSVSAYYPALGSPLWSQTTQFKIQVLTMIWVKKQILAGKLQKETGLTNRSPVKSSLLHMTACAAPG
jgi:hypothetical protein